MRVIRAALASLRPIRAPSGGARITHGLILTTSLLLLAGCGTGDLPKNGSSDADSTPPTIRIVAPSEGARIAGDSVMIDVHYADQGSGITVNSFKALVNGQDVSGLFDQHSRGASGRFSPAQRLTFGENQLTVEVKDRAGNVARANGSFLFGGNGWLTLTGVVRTGKPLTSLALSPTANRIAVGEDDGTVRLWELTGGVYQERPALKGHRRAVSAVAFSPDGNTLASGGWDRTVRLWDLHNADVKPRAVLDGHSLQVLSLTFTPDGTLLASGGWDQTLRLWDLTADHPTVRATFKGQSRMTSLAFASQGQTLAHGSGDGTVRLLTVKGTEVTEQAAFAGHSLPVLSLAFSSDGKSLITGSADRTIKVWDLSGAKPVERASQTLKSAPTTVAFATNGRTLTSASQDGQLTYWNAESAQSLGQATVPESIHLVAQAVESPSLVIGSDKGMLYVLHAGIAP